MRAIPRRGPLRSFNSATARSRGETETQYRLRRATTALQFGHGTEPWRNEDLGGRLRICYYDPSIRPRHGAVEKRPPARPGGDFRKPSIRPRHGAVEKQLCRDAGRERSDSFNSATARSRGETKWCLVKSGKGIEYLQFGHGTEPWRNGGVHGGAGAGHSPSIRPRHGAVEKREKSPCPRVVEGLLQFGHGTEPWRNPTGRLAWHPQPSFNSATARSRGETDHGRRSLRGHGRPSIRPRHGAVEKRHRCWAHNRVCPPSIRPRHGAVEKLYHGKYE